MGQKGIEEDARTKNNKEQLDSPHEKLESVGVDQDLSGRRRDNPKTGAALPLD
jgi:hypothetical protein